jgi:hypothetical protein
MIRRQVLSSMLVIFGAVCAGPALAQGNVTFTKPVKLVVPFGYSRAHDCAQVIADAQTDRRR